jgi:hypothetical protein
MTYAVQVVQSPRYYSGDRGLTDTPQLPLALREDAEPSSSR